MPNGVSGSIAHTSVWGESQPGAVDRQTCSGRFAVCRGSPVVRYANLPLTRDFSRSFHRLTVS